jgi:RHH-type transcriptional regulator, proline utilization regulon repressor / proline dehydrogenase / delta 1-pyrroline-5-carboxylate dehydrogenase
MTGEDAERYLAEYEKAIHAIGEASAGRGIFEGPGISIKLSALHPRYGRAQADRVMNELYPVLVRLCLLAKLFDIGLNIDAEEADRLEISLDLLEMLAFEPQLQSWSGLGFVVQAYQKRCPFVIDYVIDLARRANRRLMIRLVKGAYWDSEIKRAQVDGQDGYPVYTRKPYTDASYIACARKLLAAPAEVYPQFATHNAHTLAAIYQLADPQSWRPGQYEFQCLHGMGEPLYEQVVGDASEGKLGRPCRIYAPVGTHETLLAYLVRRLLENGANTSFVNQVADQSLPIEDLVRDPVHIIEDLAKREGQVGLPHPAIPLPRDIYGALRTNSRGIDLANESELRQLATAMDAAARETWCAGPLVAFDIDELAWQPVFNPADASDEVGKVAHADLSHVDAAIRAAHDRAGDWAATAASERARLLRAAADLLENDTPRMMSVLIREGGKTASNAVSEVREAVDFLRYYAHEVQSAFDNRTHVPLGPVVCISPWNFPLAIFLGQISAALAAGNVVLAKPAEQTPLIAAEAVRLLWAAGIPRHAVQLLPGEGSVAGAALVADARVQGVLFTGSTEVARLLQRAVAGRVTSTGRAIPLIAETGGQNAMIVDSSALAEQVVGDVLVSAFDSAGQRCSALRVLCVQEDAADRILKMLLGAVAELRIGSPTQLATDVGPVIDAEAKRNIDEHVSAMRAKGRRVHQVAGREDSPLPPGTFVLPTVIEIDSIGELEREVFGPVLHFVRYRREDIDGLLGQINGTGYGLTMGLHTRIDETIERVVASARAGNVYVNRNMVGAVVGVQPFGGEGLSGTGPKAGGPLYLYRLLAQRPGDVLARATGIAEGSPLGKPRELAGPTGERNVYMLAPRSAVLCLADTDSDRLVQLAAVRRMGARAIWPLEAKPHYDQLPPDARADVVLARDCFADEVHFESVLLHGSIAELAAVQAKLAERKGPVVCVERLAPGDADVPLERLVVERALSINTAAAGGNASLMTIG